VKFNLKTWASLSTLSLAAMLAGCGEETPPAPDAGTPPAAGAPDKGKTDMPPATTPEVKKDDAPAPAPSAVPAPEAPKTETAPPGDEKKEEPKKSEEPKKEDPKS
jgi:outer membrane biosynthesis protein TonB